MVRRWRWVGGVWTFAAVALVSPADSQQPAARVVTATISGTVYDSVGKRGLGEAFVQLVPHADVSKGVSTVADAQGRYRFDGVAAGTYLLGFYHPVLDSLSLTAPVTRVDVRTTGDIRAPLAIPSAATIISAVCPTTTTRDSTGLVMGFVRSARDGALSGKATVRVRWSEITIGSKGIEHATPTIDAVTSDAGGFAICGIPAESGSSVLLRAWIGPDSSGLIDLDVPHGGLLRRDVYVGSATPETVAVAADSSAPDSGGPPLTTSVLRGRGTLRGTVRRSDGQPIDGARILFWGTGVEVASNANGIYQMQRLPGGTYTLEARALGFVPIRRPVDIVEGRDEVADFTMSGRAAYLDTVRVLGQRVYISQQMKDFERRKKMGFGYFMDEDAIEKRNPINVSDLFRMTPGVIVAPGGMGSRVLMRGGGMLGGGYCAPTVYVDGMRVFNESGDLETIVGAHDIRALEVYSRGSSVPVQFQTLSGCGSIVIWTGSRRRLPAEEKEKRER
jgi:hypothetical protein